MTTAKFEDIAGNSTCDSVFQLFVSYLTTRVLTTGAELMNGLAYGTNVRWKKGGAYPFISLLHWVRRRLVSS